MLGHEPNPPINRLHDRQLNAVVTGSAKCARAFARHLQAVADDAAKLGTHPSALAMEEEAEVGT